MPHVDNLPLPDVLFASERDLERGADWPGVTPAEECCGDLEGEPVRYLLETPERVAAGKAAPVPGNEAGERTPGPYYRAASDSDDLRHRDIRHRDQPGRPVAYMPSWMEENEREKLVALLNKGERFDELLAAAKALLAELEDVGYGGPWVTGFDIAFDLLGPAIAKADGMTDG